MLHKIRHRFNGSVLFELDCDSMRACVEAGLKTKADLRRADLRGANLSDADLRDADPC